MSATHLGHSQFGLYEREKDMYKIFEEAIDESILERARIVILAGDLFHMPRPNG
jgi:DNA repair exonuclease SbcCD nuclease subunit